MPGFVIGLIAGEVIGSAVATAVGSALIGRIIGGVTGSIIGGAVSRAIGGGGKPEEPTLSGSTTQARGRLVTIRQAVSRWQVVYGQARVGGDLTFAHESANNNFHLIITLAGHVCEEIGDIYFNDDVVPLDGSGNATGTYAGYVRIQKSLGAETGQPFPDLVTESEGKWTANHLQRGRAKIYVRLTANGDLFPGGIPNITAVVKGRLVLDPRLSPGETVWSDNVALCVNDYLTNTVFGVAANYANEIDEATLISAANECDETVDLAGSPSATEKRYTANGAFRVSENPKAVLERLLGAMAGWAVNVGGKWYIFAGAYEAPTVTFDEGDLAGSIRVQSLLSRRDGANGVKGFFIDPDQSWQPVSFPPIPGSAYLAEDENEREWRDVDLTGFTTSGTMAQRLAKIELLRARQGLTVSAQFKLLAYLAMTGRTVALTNAKFGWTAKAFDVVGSGFFIAANGELGVRLDLRETAAAIYDWATSDEQSVDIAPNTTLPDPLAGLAVTNLTLTSGTADLFVNNDGTVVPRIRARWTAATQGFVTRYDVQLARAAGSPQDWVDAPKVLAPATEGYAHPVEDGVAYDVRVRAVSIVGHAGAWAYALNHTVVGKTAVPANVTNFSAQQNGANVNFRWDQVSDADLAGYEIRYNPLGDSTWANGTVVTSVTRGTAITNGFVPPGSWTLMIKARDTSGNYSTTPATTTITVSSELDVIVQREEAPRWLGTKSNFVEHWTGVLVPDSQSLASALGWEVFDEVVPDPYATCEYEAPEIDGGFDDTVRAWGDITSVLAPGETDADDPVLYLDYRAASGSYDGFEPWTIGSVEARYFKHKIRATTANGIVVISAFTPTVDAEEYVQRGDAIVVPAGGLAVSFSPAFHVTPNVQVSAQAAGSPLEARYANPSGITTSGFTAQVFNAAGADVGGTIDWQARGV